MPVVLIIVLGHQDMKTLGVIKKMTPYAVATSVIYQLSDIGLHKQFIKWAKIVHVQANTFVCVKSSIKKSTCY